MALQLVIGDKNYSSWSMHAWLLLRFVDMPFEEIAIFLYVADARQRVRELGGETGLVPVLSVDGHPIWDTLAITEFVYEQHPAVWPTDCFERGRARSYAGEVHSSLNDLRAAMPVNTRARARSPVRTAAVEADIARVASIWDTSGNDPESPWLFGRFTAADIMFAPVATRFQTYNVAMSGRAAEYQERLLSHPLLHEWLALGELEPTVIEQFELPGLNAS